MFRKSAGSADAGTIGSSLPHLRRNMSGKLSGTAEEVVAWAWRIELPKVPSMGRGPLPMAGGWDKAGRFAELLSLVDLYGVNDYGVVPDFAAASWPCRDAVMIADAVAGLDDCELEMPEPWDPAPELAPLGGLAAKAVADAWRRMTVERNGATALRLKPSELIVRRAVLGWDVAAMVIDDVEQRFEVHANGQDKWFVRRSVDTDAGPMTVEVNGWSTRTRRPLPGAYRKPYLDPDPVAAIIARAEHEIWLSALAVVHEAVAASLEEVEMLPPVTSSSPWLVADRRRILPDVVAEVALQAEAKRRHDAVLAARHARWFRTISKISGDPA